MRAGCDPGYANLGFNWLDTKKNESLMWKVNLKFWDNEEHDLGVADIGPCVYEFCLRHKKHFMNTSEFAVENLPPAIYGKPTEVLVRDVMTSMALAIHILYPHIKVYYVAPMTMKALSKTTGAKSHTESKKRTSECSILPKEDMMLAVARFRGENGKLQVDPIDATIASMCLENRKEVMQTSRYHMPGVVRKFKIVEFTSPVVYPKQKATRIRKLLENKQKLTQKPKTRKRSSSMINIPTTIKSLRLS